MSPEQRAVWLAAGYAKILLDAWDLCPCQANEIVLSRRLLDTARESVNICLPYVKHPEVLAILLDACAETDKGWSDANRVMLSRGLHKVGAYSALPQEQAEDAGAAPTC